MKRLLVPITALGLLHATAVEASEWHRAGAEHVYADGSAAASSHLRRNEAALGLSTVSLVERRSVDARSFRTVRFEQTFGGLPVLGGQVAVRVGADGRVTRTVMNVARDLTVTTIASVDERTARALAARRAGVPSASAARLVVLPDDQGGKLVWEIDVRTLDGGRRYWIDAHAATLLNERPLAVHALGTVYPISSVTTPITEDRELTDLVVSTPQLLNGWSGNLTVTNYVSGDSMNGNYVLEQLLEPSMDDDFLYEPPAIKTDDQDGFAQVSIYYHLTRMRDFATNTLGVDMTSSSWKLVAVANMQEGGGPMDNAFFSSAGIGSPWNAPNLIAIGQGSTFDFAQDSDVFNHEFTHYLTHNAIDYNGSSFHIDSWGRSHFSAAIDEGISDYLASTVNGDSFLGEASLALLGSGRDLANTSKNCPDDMDGEVHSDGEIIGSVSWSFREAFGAEIADELVWGAASLLTLGAPFGDFSNGLVQTAADMVAAGTITSEDAAVVDEILAARGLDDCGHELALTEAQQVNLNGLGGFCGQAQQNGFTRQSMFHYVITPGPDALGIAVNVAIQALSDGDEPNWNLYVRAGEHVSFQTSFPPSVSAYDYALEGVTTTSAKLIIDELSTPAFDPDTTYHLVLTHQQCSNSIAELSFTDVLTPPNTGEGGGMGAGGEGGADNTAADGPTEVTGCGCRTAGGPTGHLGWMFALLGAVAVRRRSRQR